MANFGEIKSFGDIKDWYRMERPYIAVFRVSCRDQMEDGVRFAAKVYDGEYYTGYHMLAGTFVEVEKDITESRPELHRESPGAADPDELLCVYM